MRTYYSRTLRSISAVTLMFFSWTFIALWQIPAAFAAEKQTVAARGHVPGKEIREPNPEERFEKALESIRENIGKAEEKSQKGQDITAEVAEVKKYGAEIEALDVELRKEFAATEKKLKDAKLPKEILDRHYRFVKHYEGNLKELKTNLSAVDKPSATSHELRAALQKAKAHLEKTKPPRKHVPLDPDNLPFRNRKAKAPKAPRLKKEEFEKEFGPQKKAVRSSSSIASNHEPRATNQELFHSAIVNHKSEIERKPVLLAYNGPASDIPLSLGDELRTQPVALPFTGNGISSGVNPDATFSDLLSATSYEPSAILLAQAADLPTPADLAETPDVQFTVDIKNLAAQLNYSPVKIFEWVRNNIEFVPTYGSVQGADMCLQSRQCNALDTASLLIALLRTSNRPARYAYGTIEVPIEKVKNWVGGFTDPLAAATLISSGGIPGRIVISGGKPSKIQIEHVWVETYIPYGNYRGAIMDDSIKTWIPMDGSYKQYIYTNGFDITPDVPFSQDEYLSQVQSQNPVHYYQSKIQQYLDASMPETTIIDVKGHREITQETYHFLPTTLPYITVAQLGTFSSTPDGMKAKVTFRLSSPETGMNVSYTASTAELAGKRITVSYIPATSADQDLIASYGGFLYNVPAYLLNLKPVLRLEGDIKLTADAATLGSEQSLTIQFEQPASWLNETVRKPIYAGAYYAIGIDLQGINENVLGKRNYQITTNVMSETAGTLGNDDLIGEHLHILATTYFLANDKIYKTGAKLYNSTLTRTISEAITSFTLYISYLFSIPRTAMPSGVNIDVAMDRVIAVAKNGAASKEKALMDVAGLVSSYHEHDIFERIDNFSAVSTVRALQVAGENGIPIRRIDTTNIAQVLPALQVSTEIKADIQNAVNAGKEVTIPRANVQVNDWSGVGYIIKDPITGSGTYMITGGLAGGDSTSDADGMRVAQIHRDPGAWVRDSIDPQTRNTIVMAAELNVDEILSVAEDAVGMSYGSVNQCVGLVRIAYWAGGICLDMWSPWAPLSGTGSCGRNNLVQKHHISGTNGVSYFYNLADHLKVNENDARMTNDPLVGDLIFWDNTHDKNGDCIGNDERTHVGIVKWAPDEHGTLLFIHASGSGVKTDQLMNVSDEYSADPSFNTYLRNSWKPSNSCTQDQWNSVGKLAGQLFAGFATIRDTACNAPSHQ